MIHNVVILIVAGMCIAPPIVQAAPPITIMTFNIRYDENANLPSGGDHAWISNSGRHRRDAVLQVIGESDPDILAVQEALSHQVSDIADYLSGYEVYAVGRDDGEALGEHCGIYFRANRFEKSDQGTFWLCNESNEPGAKHPDAACPRIASWVRLRERSERDRELLVLNTHWDHVSQPAREFAARAIADFLAGIEAKVSVVVVGDMNAHEDSAEMMTLLGDDGARLTDAYRSLHPAAQDDEATFNGFANRVQGKRIDYVLHTPDLSALSASIVRTTPYDKNASDHFPVLAELAWRN